METIVIGGANLDITGIPDNGYKPADSNPGRIFMSPGGVGRNIAENIQRLKIQTSLLTIFGDDTFSQQLMDLTRGTGINLQHSTILKNTAGSVYLAVLDDKKDMTAAVSSMDAINNFTPSLLLEKQSIITNANACVIDTNIPEETIKTLLKMKNLPPIFADTVSTSKAAKLGNNLENIFTLKPNRIEAETLSGVKIQDNISLKKTGSALLQRGVSRVCISLGEEGVFITDGNIFRLIKTPPLPMKSATGAGDAFTAGLVYGFLHGEDFTESVKSSCACAAAAVNSYETINPNLSPELIISIKSKTNFTIDDI